MSTTPVLAPRHRADSFAVIGVYADGAVRHHHVTTDDVETYAASLLTGFLPFSEVFTIPCADMWTCHHSSVVPA